MLVAQQITAQQEFDEFLRRQLNVWHAKSVEFLAAKLGVSVAGPWGAAISWIVANVLDSASNPRRQGQAMLAEVDKQDSEWVAQAAPVRDVALPAGYRSQAAELTLQTAGGSIPHDAKILTLPFTQTVTIEWDLTGHGAFFQESVARGELVANRGGLWRPWLREVWGKAGFGTRSNSDRGSTQLTLPAGVYLARVVASNPLSSGRVTIRYQTVSAAPTPPPSRTAPWWLLGGLAVAVGMLLYAGRE